MTKRKWKKKIEEACAGVGTYKEEFEDVISTLATILEQRDDVMKKYEEEGRNPVVAYTNKNGATNTSKSPYLTLWCDLNSQALAYWRDLGLTPKGLKAINDGMKSKKKTGLAEVLKNIEKDLS